MNILSERTMNRINKVVVSGRIIPFVALATLAITVAAGLAAWILSPEGFDGLGDAMWWAAQTVTTVGYGDVVPDTTGGRLVGVAIMLIGVASVSLITALVTSAFVSYQQRRMGGEQERHQELLETLARLERKLESIEQRPAD
jgi:voltage-gated potassium channel